MDDDLEPISAEPVEMRLTLPRGNRQMRLSALAYRWLREAKGLAPDEPLKIIAAQVKGAQRLAIVVSDDGLVVDPGNYYCSGVGLRRLLGNPRERVDIALEPNAEKGRLEGVLPDPNTVTIPNQAGGAPADAKPSKPIAGSEPRKGADDQVAPRPTSEPKKNKAAELRAETEKAAERVATLARCPQCGTEAPQQGTLYNYNTQPPTVTALVFSCPNGHRFETRQPGANVVVDEDDSDQAVTLGPASEPPKRLIDEPDSDHPGLPAEDVNAIDVILAEDDADTDEVNPEWLAALHGETHDDAG
jgi:hypothetical protein